jgi:glutaryl-CoA dehydrogenase
MTSTIPDITPGEQSERLHREGASQETAGRSTNLLGQTFPRVDFYAIDDLLKPEEREIRDAVREFVDREIIPIAGSHWERAEFPFHLLPKLGDLGIIGGALRGYGCPGLSPVADGLVAAELSRGDVSFSTAVGVHSGLAMTSIWVAGSEEQKRKWLPKMAKLEALGAFGLTEPLHGSDAAHIQTTAKRDGDSYVLNGAKRWIGLGHLADVVVVWARDLDNDGSIAGFLVEKGTPGFAANLMAGKVPLRMLGNADLTFTDVRIPAENRLGGSTSFRETAMVLTATRYGVACSALGSAMACYEAALAYATKRQQFGKPIAGHQIVQQKLVWMLAEITGMQLMCWRLGTLLGQLKMTGEQASLAKLNHSTKLRKIAAEARDIMGGNGILLDNLVIRHFNDAEAIYSYEGTAEVQTLVVGRKITGLQAFA